MIARREIRRVRVQRYTRSGKLAVIYAKAGYFGYTVLELSPDMRFITIVRNRNFVKRGTFSPTLYIAEIVEEEVGREGGTTSFNHRLVRHLTAEDIDFQRWMSTESLDALPVSPVEEFMPEERAWAGEREGNLGGGIVLGLIVGGAIWAFINTYPDDPSYLFFAAVGAVACWFLVTYSWKLPKKPLPAKLEELKAHKDSLRRRSKERTLAARTAFETSLADFENWRRLSPQEFEHAVTLLLQREGFTAQTTSYSKDGGVDIEAVDNLGRSTIVQAKHYRQKVGVSVVREMIGIRETRGANPRTMIYSLVGFTRGAQKLAESHGVDLRDIRTMLNI